MTIILKIQNFYLEYSTVSDCPSSRGMDREQIRDYLLKRMGTTNEILIDEFLRCADETGTSTLESLDSVLFLNRAGLDETCLTIDEIYQYYCLNQRKGEKPLGISIMDSMDDEI
jgi:hypothetical protein